MVLRAEKWWAKEKGRPIIPARRAEKPEEPSSQICGRCGDWTPPAVVACTGPGTAWIRR